MKASHYIIVLALIVYIPLNAQYTQRDWKDRDQWMNVNDLFNLADLGAGHLVADIGCHEGYLSMHLAKTVGKDGKVYAVDVQSDRLETLKKHVKKRKLQNVEVILGDYDNPKLPDGTLDVVFVIDAYHEMESYEAMLSHFKTALKPGGRLVLLEKLKKHMKSKMREQQVDAHTLEMKYVKNELKVAGFSILREVQNFGNWERDLTKTMWVVVAEKPGD